MANRTTVPFQSRVSADLIEKIDEWLAVLNAKRVDKLTRSDLVRVLLSWGAYTRPDFDSLNRAAAETAAGATPSAAVKSKRGANR